MATLQQRLEEAETAYHDLLIGKSAVQFRDSSGEFVQYTAANVQALARYITSLKAEIAAANGTPSCDGPMRPFIL